ncbi:MAG: bifunctional 5,10-methylenetetrahydrofolate dehydrogenase/5,10-methenyltetrahydrofolate cyclohydrolase, partial [Candidatus Omnitrophota bacterium]
MTRVIDGRKIADQIGLSTKERLGEIVSRTGASPKLVSIMAGRNKEAEIYLKMQEKMAGKIGIEFEARELDEGVSREKIIKTIEELNADKSATAVILQRPLPEGIDYDSMLARLLPEKDAEGLHPFNLGKILRREADIVPCTPGAVMKILRVEGVDLYGKEVVIIGHSAIVGKPLS